MSVEGANEKEKKEEEQIIYTYIMKSFLEYINKSFEINEALKSSLLGKVALATSKIPSLKRGLASIEEIDWDNISDDMFDRYDGAEAKKVVTKVISKDINGVVIICMDDEDEPTYVVNSIKRLIDLKRGTDEFQDTRSKILLYTGKAKAVYVLDRDAIKTQVLKTRNLKIDRRDSREGSIDSSDPEQMRRIAQANMERYKTMIAKNRAVRDDEIIVKAQSAMGKAMDLVNRMSVNMTRYSKVSYKIEQLMQMTYGYSKMDKYNDMGYEKGLLQLLSQYMSYKQQVDKDSASPVHIEIFVKTKKAIYSLIDAIESKMNEISKA